MAFNIAVPEGGKDVGDPVFQEKPDQTLRRLFRNGGATLCASRVVEGRVHEDDTCLITVRVAQFLFKPLFLGRIEPLLMRVVEDDEIIFAYPEGVVKGAEDIMVKVPPLSPELVVANSREERYPQVFPRLSQKEAVSPLFALLNHVPQAHGKGNILVMIDEFEKILKGDVAVPIFRKDCEGEILRVDYMDLF